MVSALGWSFVNNETLRQRQDFLLGQISWTQGLFF
jgi:hypothetical protein